MTPWTYRRPHRPIRSPALALVGLMVLAWAPCLACEKPAHVHGAPGLAAPASCHGGDSEASCAPAIRATGSALRAPVVPPAMAPVLPAPAPDLGIPRPVADRSQPVPRAGLHRPPLYLLHASLLA
jgi:hypothetical protein